MDLKDIKAIIELMKKNDLSVFKLEREDFKIVLERGTTGVVHVAAPAAAPLLLPAPAAAPAAAAPAPAATSAAPAAAPASDSREISSPMVGTFYSAPSPESPAFVKVGDSVDENTVVCIVEAMKVMNEIKAETKGTIVEIVAENGKPVQFGQPLFRVR
ncbi:MAG: acetyl-CoA carboxylase biotin carboxyl carrier protein [Verrucomicrobia bacterium]|nr:acetyl-CoA carboxylase biotin carboxyl carrier protein [Verrucomicrobiota bacterium]